MFKKDGNNEIKTLSHSTYRCQYHIVFAPKYRRKEIYGKLKKDIGEIIRKLCEQKGVDPRMFCCAKIYMMPPPCPARPSRQKVCLFYKMYIVPYIQKLF